LSVIKLLVLSHTYPTPDGNTNCFVHGQVKELARQGCDVRVVCPVPWAPYPLPLVNRKWRNHAKTPLKGRVEGISVVYPRYPMIPHGRRLGVAGYLMYHGVRNAIVKMRDVFDFDIIHAHMVFPDGVAASLLKRRGVIDKPLCITAHGSDIRIYSRNPLCRTQIVRALETAELVVSGHPEIVELIHRLGRGDVAEIANGIDLGKFQSCVDLGYIKKELGFSPEHFLVTFVGNLIPFKDPETLIRAIPAVMEQRNDVRFVVVGDGILKASLEKLSHELGVNARVSFAGYRNDIEQILAVSDVFVALSPVENIWSTTILEAMAAAVPCIVTRAGTTEQYLEHERTAYLIEKRNPQALAAAILYLLNNKEMREELAQNGSTLVRESFDVQQSATELIELYSRVLSVKGDLHPVNWTEDKMKNGL